MTGRGHWHPLICNQLPETNQFIFWSKGNFSSHYCSTRYTHMWHAYKTLLPNWIREGIYSCIFCTECVTYFVHEMSFFFPLPFHKDLVQVWTQCPVKFCRVSYFPKAEFCGWPPHRSDILYFVVYQFERD